MSKQKHSHWKTLHLRLAEADMVFWLMPALIILLITGTIAQRWLGLYEAHHLFFKSLLIWLGPVPLPGGMLILGILTINLTAKFLFKSKWRLSKSGIILTHLGTLVLLLGGLITSLVAEERYMIIGEGEETPFLYHYTDKSLLIFEDNENQNVIELPYAIINEWSAIELPFQMNITNHCENCNILKREESEG